MSNILLGVTGGIAAYKSAYLVRLFINAGHNVRVITTSAADTFVSPLTFEALSGNPVFRPGFSPYTISHIEWAKWADIFVVAPATADIIGKFASGIADDPLSTTFLAFNGPLLIAPAMNSQMFCNQAVTFNMDILAKRGAYLINSGNGMLACGDTGKGRMAEPENIFAAAESLLLCRDRKTLEVKKVLVTAGPTREYIDPVRYITNMSSGKMGYAIAEAAWAAGADVTLIAGTTGLSTFLSDVIQINSASDMEKAVLERSGEADIIIMAAAVADYRPADTAKEKIKKIGDSLDLHLIKTGDILKTLGENKKNNQTIVGFAAETENLDTNAMKKLKNKKADMIIANNVSQKNSGFDSDYNKVKIFFKNGSALETQKTTKRAIASEIIYLLKKASEE